MGSLHFQATNHECGAVLHCSRFASHRAHLSLCRNNGGAAPASRCLSRQFRHLLSPLRSLEICVENLYEAPLHHLHYDCLRSHRGVSTSGGGPPKPKWISLIPLHTNCAWHSRCLQHARQGKKKRKDEGETARAQVAATQRSSRDQDEAQKVAKCACWCGKHAREVVVTAGDSRMSAWPTCHAWQA